MMICDDVESTKSRLSVAQLYGGVVNMGVDVPLDACKLNLHPATDVNYCEYTIVKMDNHHRTCMVFTNSDLPSFNCSLIAIFYGL